MRCVESQGIILLWILCLLWIQGMAYATWPENPRMLVVATTSIDPLMYRIGSSNEGHRLQGLNQECKTLGFNSNDFCICQDGNNGEDPSEWRRCL
ncbi:hypothetical protein EJB05_23799 [Eragrostis curvula]|uniref:S-locus glycoprotein domain-containing protein n=1 Tax=Eragrostis curvula TaxID=38414 RepID=A0A5J9V9C3_9POAL|nr:hypothetical protein EJB05_23799 [Eragrostis curvula]